ncbi:HNH endonuclease [Maritalea porphyrae]|uniref:HNH endonuclease n=1 Tax=Maritalea porphyrae TaxID=880732 RepID=UPI0022AEB79B|nr:HNH endonuclease [Maritalea porphyrae]MCZ4270935.1 HNH endonuclease [Maritalea porphyrae]
MTKLANPIGRSTDEWFGATADTKAPPRVELRVFERYGGICYLSGIKILPGMKWELEHIKALCNGGENRESNLAPALVKAHKAKTAQDRKEKAKSDRIRKKHLGITKPKQKIRSRGFSPSPDNTRYLDEDRT